MVASNAPKNARAEMRPAKFFAAAVQMVTMDHMIMLNKTQFRTGKTMRAYPDKGWQTS